MIQYLPHRRDGYSLVSHLPEVNLRYSGLGLGFGVF